MAASIAIAAAHPAMAQEATCAERLDERPTRAVGTQSDAAKLRSPEALVRDMARADIAYSAGRRDEAAAIYARLAQAPADRRQTARRANLKLAQAAIAAGDYTQAESYIAKGTARGALPAMQDRARELRRTIADRQDLAADNAALAQVDTLVEARRFDEALAATGALLSRACPNPEDYSSRVRLRLAQVYRAKGDLPLARTTAATALAGASTPAGRERATTLIGQIDNAIRVAALRTTLDEGTALAAAGDNAGAVGLLHTLVEQADLPPEIDTPARLRLARSYGQLARYDEALAVTQPLLAGSTLNPDEYDAIARIRLARAGSLQVAGQLPEAQGAYQEILVSAPPPAGDTRDSARLGLARVLAAQGDRGAALEQIGLVRDAAFSPRLVQRAADLLSDIEDGAPLNRLVGYIEAGAAYDSNVPTRLSALRDDDDDDVSTPTGERLEDGSASLTGRLEYRHQLSSSGSYLDLVATGMRTFQFDLPQFDRTRLGALVGPAIMLPGGQTALRFGGVFEVEWRGGSFRSSEPGAFVGITHDFTDQLSAAATYTLTRRNDYRDERDGTDHALEGQLRYEPGDADVLTFDLRAKREGGRLERVRNTRLLAGAGWRHRWTMSDTLAPFLEGSAEAERIMYDGVTSSGAERRDWRVKLEAAAGVEIDRTWRASVNYAYFDLSSTIPERNRVADHQVGVTIRRTWR